MSDYYVVYVQLPNESRMTANILARSSRAIPSTRVYIKPAPLRALSSYIRYANDRVRRSLVEAYKIGQGLYIADGRTATKVLSEYRKVYGIPADKDEYNSMVTSFANAIYEGLDNPKYFEYLVAKIKSLGCENALESELGAIYTEICEKHKYSPPETIAKTAIYEFVNDLKNKLKSILGAKAPLISLLYSLGYATTSIVETFPISDPNDVARLAVRSWIRDLTVAKAYKQQMVDLTGEVLREIAVNHPQRFGVVFSGRVSTARPEEAVRIAEEYLARNKLLDSPGNVLADVIENSFKEYAEKNRTKLIDLRKLGSRAYLSPCTKTRDLLEYISQVESRTGKLNLRSVVESEAVGLLGDTSELKELAEEVLEICLSSQGDLAEAVQKRLGLP